MNYDLSKQKILNKYPESKIMSSFRSSDGYIFSIKPKSWKKEDYVLDGLFKVSRDGKITEYSPVANPEEFKKALKNRLE